VHAACEDLSLRSAAVIAIAEQATPQRAGARAITAWCGGACTQCRLRSSARCCSFDLACWYLMHLRGNAAPVKPPIHVLADHSACSTSGPVYVGSAGRVLRQLLPPGCAVLMSRFMVTPCPFPGDILVRRHNTGSPDASKFLVARPNLQRPLRSARLLPTTHRTSTLLKHHRPSPLEALEGLISSPAFLLLLAVDPYTCSDDPDSDSEDRVNASGRLVNS